MDALSVVSPCCLASCSSFNALLVLFCYPTRVDPQNPHPHRVLERRCCWRPQLCSLAFAPWTPQTFFIPGRPCACLRPSSRADSCHLAPSEVSGYLRRGGSQASPCLFFFGGGVSPGSPSRALPNPFFGWEDSPTKIGNRKKGILILTSPLEDLAPSEVSGYL